MKFKTIKQLEAEMKIGNGQTLVQFKLKEGEISAKKIKTVEELISSTPNDQELGEKIRKMFNK